MNPVCGLLMFLPTVACIEIGLSYHKRPFGPKMCVHVCRHTEGCSSVLFSTVALRCLVCPEGNPLLDGLHENFTEITVKDVFTRQRRTCAKNFRIITNRAKVIICVNPASTSNRTGKRNGTNRTTDGSALNKQNWGESKASKAESETVKVKRQPTGYHVHMAGDSFMSIKKYTVKMTWDDAMSYCQEEGARLVKVDTQANLKALRSMYDIFELVKHELLWIGLRDLHGNDTFFWSDGDPVSFSSWQPTEPSHNYNGLDEDCVAADPSWDHTRWTDRVCGERFTFMCQLSE